MTISNICSFPKAEFHPTLELAHSKNGAIHYGYLKQNLENLELFEAKLMDRSQTAISGKFSNDLFFTIDKISEIACSPWSLVSKAVISLWSESSVRQYPIVIKEAQSGSYPRLALFKESLVHQLTKNMSHVAGGGIRIKLKTDRSNCWMLIDHLYEGDGRLLSNLKPEGESVIYKLLDDALSGSEELQMRDLYNTDTKPENYLIRIHRSGFSLFNSDHGSVYYLPDPSKITEKKLKILSSKYALLNEPMPSYLVEMFNHIETLSIAQKVHYLIACETLLKFEFLHTLYTSNHTLRLKLMDLCARFKEAATEREILTLYYGIRSTIQIFVVYQISISVLSIISPSLLDSLSHRPRLLNEREVKAALNDANVQNEALQSFFSYMLNIQIFKTPIECKRRWLQIAPKKD